MRLFLAIYPPQEYIRYFADVYRHFEKEKRNLKPIPVDRIHVTLKFIGPNVSVEHTDEMIDLLKRFEGQYPKPTIQIDDVKFGFGRQTDPKHLLASIEDNEELDELEKDVRILIRSLKFKDTIRWRTRFTSDYHITIARLKETATRSSGKEIIKLAKELDIEPPPPFIADSMVFVESVMRYDGPVYRKIESVKL